MSTDDRTPPVAVVDGEPTILRQRATWVMLASVVALVVLWMVFIQLEWGQRLDDLAIESRTVESPAAISQNSTALNLVTNASLALGCIVFLVVGFVRRRPLLGLAAVCSVGAATVTTEILKRIVIDRPIRFVEAPDLVDNTFPSGHATISTALALAALMVTPVRWRAHVAVVGALWVTFQCTGVVSAGWHRPSDALAGLAVALGWAAFAVLMLALLRRVERADTEGNDERGAHWILLVLAFVLVALVLSVVIAGDSPWSWGGIDFLIASAVIDIAGVAVVVVMLALLRGCSLGRRVGGHGSAGSANSAPTIG
ncbi:MAG: phosphatase PAP2 family protein [Microthrixaceae bacterium]